MAARVQEVADDLAAHRARQVEGDVPMARAQEIVDDLGYQPASPQRGATALLPAPSIPVISAGNPSLFRDLIRGGEPTALVRRTARIQAIATRPQERD